MTVGILKIMYHLPYAQTLKEKRQKLLSIKQILRKKFNISISETGYQDLWQKSLIGISMVCDGKNFVDKIFNKIIDEFNRFKFGYIAEFNTEYLNVNEHNY